MAVLLISNSRMVATVSMVGKAPHRRLHLALEVKGGQGPLQYSGFVRRDLVRMLVTRARKAGSIMIVSLKDNTDAGTQTRRLITWSKHGHRMSASDIEMIAANGGRL